MKKRLTAVVLMLAFFVTSAFAASQYKQIQVEYGIQLDINGEIPMLTDANNTQVQPFTYNGTTYVPIRAVAENMGASIGYFSDTQTAQIWQDDKEAMYAAHKIERASFKISEGFSTLASASGQYVTMTNQQYGNIVNVVLTAYQDATSSYDAVVKNDNQYKELLSVCMDALHTEYKLFERAAPAVLDYKSTGNKTSYDNFYSCYEDFVADNTCKEFVALFFDTLW